jgi:hypothetical protein
LITPATSLTWMGRLDPFWMDTGTGPEAPPICTWGAVMIVT